MIVVYALAIFGAWCLAFVAVVGIRLRRGELPVAPASPSAEQRRELLELRRKAAAFDAAFEHLVRCPGCIEQLLAIHRRTIAAGAEPAPPH